MSKALSLVDKLIQLIDAEIKDGSVPVTSPSFRLTYYAFMGVRSGPIRTAAAIGGIAFEDRIISMDDQKQQKAEGKRRWSGVPELELLNANGDVVTQIGQSSAILRYVGSIAGLFPENNLVSCAVINEILDAVEDLANIWIPIYFTQGEDKQKAAQEGLMKDDKLPYWMKKLNNRLVENAQRGNRNGYVVGDSLSIADLKMYYGLTVFNEGGPFKYIDRKVLMSSNPELDAFCKKIAEIPQLKRFEEVTFAETQKQNKDSQKTEFRYDGRGVYAEAESESKSDVTSPSFRVKYFPMMGVRAGPIRATAAIGGIAFEDQFISFAEQGKQKAEGKRRWSGPPEMELLNANGETVSALGQSGAILRYVGSICGLYPENNMVSCAVINEIIDAVEDCAALWIPCLVLALFGKSEDEQKAAQEAIMKADKLPVWMKKFNNRLVENAQRGNKNGFLVGDSLSIADIKLYYNVCTFNEGGPFKYIDRKSLFDSNPELDAFCKKIGAIPQLKQFESSTFADSVKQNQENKKNNFRYDGKGVYAESKADSVTPPPSFRLKYFPMMGVRAGPVRATAAIGGIAFEDQFISFAEQGKQKAEGQRRWSGPPEMELLNESGSVVSSIGQSCAILRYVGSICGLYPENDMVSCAIINEIIDAVEDCAALWIPAVLTILFQKSEDEQKTAQETIMKADKLPYWLSKFNNRLVENAKRGNKNGFLVGDTLSIADIKLYYGTYAFMEGGPFKYIDRKVLFDSNPELLAFVSKIGAIPQLKKFEWTTFADSVKQNKESKANNFRYGGKGVYPVTAPSFRLKYFAGMGGRGGPIRAAAAIGGIAFEDQFVTGEEQKQDKSEGKRRWSGLPEVELLSANGEIVSRIGQSSSILRYVGSISGLYPGNDLVKCAMIDELVDAVEDTVSLWIPVYRANSQSEDEQKTVAASVMKADKLPYWMRKFNDRLVENAQRGNKNGYVVGDSLTIADLKLYYGLTVFFDGGPFKYIDQKELIDTNKELSAFCKKIAEIPQLKQFEKVTFANSQKENKENQQSNFRYDGQGVYV